jgi:uncharacterized integral membrane protein (TIGR00698 family)
MGVFGRMLPGLAVLAILAVIARAIGAVTPINPLVVAIASGALVATVLSVPVWAEPGLDVHKLLLETGIVLLGAQLALEQLAATGLVVIGLATVVVVTGVLFIELLGRRAAIEPKTRALLAAGASVCGVSAVLAVAGSVDCDEADISYVAGTVLLFDAVTLIVFPLISTVLGVPDRSFGVWAGLSVFSTGPAAAVGFAVSETAGQWATVTKLVRNSFIGVLAVAYAVYYARDGERADITTVWSRFPKFLVGFLVLAVAVNIGIVDAATQMTLGRAGDWLFTLAFVGLGVELNPRRLRATGLRPVGIILAHLIVVSLAALAAVRILL